MNKYGYLDFHGKRIFYRLTKPDDNKKHPAVLFIHGARAKLDSFNLLIDVLKNKFVCLAFDHLGCGKSEGRFEDFTLQSRLDQSIFVLDYLKKVQDVNLRKIIVFGTSMGAHVASRLTEKNSVSTLILRAPASYRQDYENKRMIKDWIPWDRERKYWPWRPSLSLHAMAKFTGRLLVVKSEKDEIIPDKIISAYLKSAKKAKEKWLAVMPNAPHKISDNPLHMRHFLKIIQSYLIKL